VSISSHQRSLSDFVEQADGPSALPVKSFDSFIRRFFGSSARSPAIEEDLSISSHQRSMSDFVEQADGPSALPVKSFDFFRRFFGSSGKK